MILADCGIPWSAMANDLVGLASQPEPLLAAFDYTELRPLRLLPDQSPLRSRQAQSAVTVVQTPLSQNWEDKDVSLALS